MKGSAARVEPIARVAPSRSIVARSFATASERALAWARAREPVAAVCVMSSFGAFYFFVLLRHYLPSGIAEEEERRLYVGGAAAPLAGVAAGWLFARARALLQRSVFFPVLMALAHSAFWAVVLQSFARRDVSLTNAQMLAKFRGAIWAFAALSATVLALGAVEQRLRWPLARRQLARRIADDGYYLVPPLAAFALSTFSNYRMDRWSTVAAVVVAGLPALALHRRGLARGQNRGGWWVDACVVAVTFFLVFNASYLLDLHHYGFYFGPIASFLGGKRPLVDINCQYGVGPIYFLASFIKLRIVPPTYQGMSALLSVLTVAHFVIFYALLRTCIRSRAICILGLTALVAIRLFSGQTEYLNYPSIGPVRFLWGHVILLASALSHGEGRREKIARVLSWATFGLASIWSVETFAGVVAAYFAVIAHESWQREGKPLARWAHAARQLGGAIVAMGLAHGLLAIEIRLHSGEWPHWSYYFEYVRLYASRTGFWALPVRTWDPWAPMVIVYGASIIAVLSRAFLFGRRNGDPAYKVVLGAAILGLVEFSYYIGRSHLENLHIFLSEFFLIAFWLHRVTRPSADVTAQFRLSFAWCTCSAACIMFLSTVPGFAARFGSTALGHVANDQPIRSPWSLPANGPWRGGPLEHVQGEAVRLVRKYEPARPRIALFLEEHTRNQVLMELGKAHVWPLSEPEQDRIEPKALARIHSFEDGMKAGDVIFVGTSLDGLDEELIAGLKKRYRFTDLEASASGVRAIRLETP